MARTDSRPRGDPARLARVSPPCLARAETRVLLRTRRLHELPCRGRRLLRQRLDRATRRGRARARRARHLGATARSGGDAARLHRRRPARGERTHGRTAALGSSRGDHDRALGSGLRAHVRDGRVRRNRNARRSRPRRRHAPEPISRERPWHRPRSPERSADRRATAPSHRARSRTSVVLPAGTAARPRQSPHALHLGRSRLGGDQGGSRGRDDECPPLDVVVGERFRARARPGESCLSRSETALREHDPRSPGGTTGEKTRARKPVFRPGRAALRRDHGRSLARARRRRRRQLRGDGAGESDQRKVFFQPESVDFLERARATFEDVSTWAFDAASPIASSLAPRTIDLAEGIGGLDLPHASCHQKFVVMDDAVAYVGGMNLQGVDWDTDAHEVFEPRRMSFDATFAERVAVANKTALPAFPPRKDYVLRIDGPAVADVSGMFRRRWQRGLDSGVEYFEHATAFASAAAPPGHQDGVLAQITATVPEPFAEQSIAETWFRAVDRAERFIFIEDQYFRAPMLNDRILARMLDVPDLVLVVVMRPVGEWADPGCAWTYQSLGLFASNFPERFLALRLEAFDVAVDPSFVVIDETDAYFVPIDLHSKMLIIDDVFMSVGSANKNNRGMIYEAELNVAVLDATWVRTERERIVRGLLPKGLSLSPTDAGWFAQLADAAAHNDAVRANWQAENDDLDLDGAPLQSAYLPRGFLYSLGYGSLSDCLFESVGPDVAAPPRAPRN
ncbi:MAG: hypothetical protein EXR75_13360 [Myxococcales bacterium]|nr:hypothetical protein [Myxococcales bacterium]